MTKFNWTYAALAILGFTILADSLLRGFQVPGFDAWVGLGAVVLYTPLAYFVWRGSEWALVISIILYFVEKGAATVLSVESRSLGAAFASPLWEVLAITIFYMAYKKVDVSISSRN